MTDYTKLIARLRTDAIFDNTTLGNEAADAIEALQAENERLKAELDKAQDEIHCAESSLEAFSCEFEAEVVSQGFDCLGDFVQALWTASNGQRDALQAKLDAMGKGEPVAYSVGNTLKWHEGKGITDAQLYAAPKALAVKWAPEEIADGMRGIRWVLPEGVFGRPTDCDVREYLQRTSTARGCQCEKCKTFYGIRGTP